MPLHDVPIDSTDFTAALEHAASEFGLLSDESKVLALAEAREWLSKLRGSAPFDSADDGEELPAQF